MKRPKDPNAATIKFKNASALFDIALKAAREIATPAREGGQQSALISIIFSVVALEAFLNEIQEDARGWYADPQASLFIDLMQDAERSRVQLESKFILSHWILTGKRPDRGVLPFQDLSLLVWLRNELVHFKATGGMDLRLSPAENHEDFMKRFRGKNLLSAPPSFPVDWIYLIETKATAGWACRTASLVALDLYHSMPNTMWKMSAVGIVEHFGRTGQFPTVMTWPLVDGPPE